MGVTLLGSISTTNTGTSLSHTVTSGTDVLYVCGFNRYSDGDIASLQYDSVSLTKVVSSSDYDATGFRAAAWIFRLINPTAGTANLTWTNASSRTFRLACINLDGVDTADPEEDTDGVGPTSTATSSTLTLTTQAGGMVLDALGIMDTANTGVSPTIGANQSETFSSNASDAMGKGSYQSGADGGAMSWTWSGTTGSDYFVHVAAAVKPAASLLGLLGVG